MNQRQPTPPKWIIYTFIGIAIALIVSAVLNVLTPKEKINQTPLTTTNYDQTTSKFSNLSYTGSAIEVPANLDIAQATIINYEKKLRADLIKQFSLKQIQSFDVWTSEDWALTIEANSGRFILSNQETIQVSGGTIALSHATAISQKFLDEYLPQYQVTPLAKQVEYFEGQYGDPAKTTANKAQIIKVAFGYEINNYPVFYKNNVDNFIEVYVDVNEKIRKVSFSTVDISLKNVGAKPALSPQTALQLANQTNQAAIINTGYQTPVKLDLSNIKSGEFSSVSIEYRVDPEQNLVYPFYRFIGSITDTKDQSFPAELITPAIEIVSIK
ncbi:hypothetical protein KJ707_02175 [Patescibacteria group bacterium]|nr:hypothetical protein [Patescibacteria group bacterium]